MKRTVILLCRLSCAILISFTFNLYLVEAKAAKNASSNPIQIQRVDFPIFLSDGTTQSMAGFLFWKSAKGMDCQKKKTPEKINKCLFKKLSTIQVVVHGFSYNHTYWDPVALNRPSYSYARYMAEKGHAVLALDLLGTGASSVPNGDVLNIEQSAFSLAQVLTSLRSKENPFQHRFRQIVLIGHSVGSTFTVLTAATFPGLVDALITTGWSYAPHLIPLSPEIIAGALQQPYAQFPPELREAVFYYPPSADPQIIAGDNTFLADQFPRGVLAQGLPLLEALALGNLEAIKSISLVDQVAVPVLVQIGEFDQIAAPLFPDLEADLYASSPDVTVEVLEQMGHSINLHENRLKSWRGINQWIEERLKKQKKPKG
jgi:pimeloyl-ACP methyl ester carboxylesterase